MNTVAAEQTADRRERAGAHRYGDHPDADGRWSCWDCGETADTRSGLAARDDCHGSSWWCSMCRRQRYAPDYECACSLSGLEYQRCGTCGQWEPEPDAVDDTRNPICRVCESASFGVGAALDAMLSASRASLLPFQRHATQYAVLARRCAGILPEDDGASVAHDYVAAFITAAEALDGLAQLDAIVERVRIQRNERRA